MGDLVYNPFSFDIQHNPFPTYRRLRDEAPVYFSEEHHFYALSRYQDVLQAHLDPATFISSNGITLEGGEQGQSILITFDPPDHEWHRKIVSRVFTPRAIGGFEPFIRQIAADLLDQFRHAGSFDVVEDFSIQLPLRVISHLLGVPASMGPDVHVLADRLFTRDDTGAITPDAQQAMGELAMLLYGLVAEKRKHPGDDVLSMMIEADVTDGERTWRLDDKELGDRTLELVFAGHETVARLIANGVVALAWTPDQRRELAADHALMPQAVEEMLRWDPPSHYQGRWTTSDVTLHGTTIPKDSRVILVTGAACHDERVYEHPERFDLHRKAERPVYFGFGVHLCLGAALARLETRIAFEELLRRYPDYELCDGAVRMRAGNVRGLAHLPISIAA